jgi:stage V sporulation protein K
MTISPSFLQELKRELRSVFDFCESLDRDQAIIKKFNDLLDQNIANTRPLKAGYFFLSDIIDIYERLLVRENEKSGFTLAYYFDVLRNHHFANENEAGALSKLVKSKDFKLLLLKIRQENRLMLKDGNNGLIRICSEQCPDKKDRLLGFYQQFILYAFDLKFKQNADLTEFFKLAPTTEPAIQKDSHIDEVVEDDSLEKVMAELDELIGLQKVKDDVKELVNLLEIQKKRSKEGLRNIDIALHTVFLGPPGTGKTSVARLLSRIYKQLGFLSKGQTYETDREGLIAGYVGQTAGKVEKAIEQSIGGVLFIDEAYSLTQNLLGNDYGPEAVNILLKRMEDHRDDLAVVVAGYTEPMKLFIESNPGLRWV